MKKHSYFDAEVSVCPSPYSASWVPAVYLHVPLCAYACYACLCMPVPACDCMCTLSVPASTPAHARLRTPVCTGTGVQHGPGHGEEGPAQHRCLGWMLLEPALSTGSRSQLVPDCCPTPRHRCGDRCTGNPAAGRHLPCRAPLTPQARHG